MLLFSKAKANILLLICFISWFMAGIRAQSTSQGCLIPKNGFGTNGFSAIIYSYNSGSVSNNNFKTFLSTKSQYASGSVLGTASNLNNVNFNAVPSIFSLNYGKIYGVNIVLTSFVVEATAFFIPTTSGVYTFKLTGLDDYAAILFSNTTAIQCCPNAIYNPSFTNNVAVYGTYSTSNVASASYTLQKGVAYPILITYVNTDGNAVLNASFVDPLGASHTDWTGYLAQATDVYKQCPAYPIQTTTTTALYTGAKTSTLTSSVYITGSDGLPTVTKVVIVETPSFSLPPPFTTTFVSGTATLSGVVSFNPTVSGTDTVTATKTSTMYPPFTTPAAYLTTVTNSRGSRYSEWVAYYSTQSNGIPFTATSISSIPPPSPTVSGCANPTDLPSTFKDTFKINLYTYTDSNYGSGYNFQQFLQYDYSSQALYGTTSGYGNINFQAYPGITLYGSLYGIYTYIPSFAAEYTSFFVPQSTGTYTFQFTGTDDYAALFIDNTISYQCCSGDQVYQPSVDNLALYQAYSSASQSINVKIVLQKGVAYPIKITFLNRSQQANLNVAFIDPSGTSHSDWTGYLASADTLRQYCAKHITTTTTGRWTGHSTVTPTTVTTSVTGSNGYPSISVIIVVNTPSPYSLPTPFVSTFVTKGSTVSELISFYSTVADNWPATGTVISTIPPFSLPSPYLTTVTTGGSTFSEVIAFYSTLSSGKMVTGASTATIPPPFTFPSLASVHTTVQPLLPSSGCVRPPNPPTNSGFDVRLFPFGDMLGSDYDYKSFLTLEYLQLPLYGKTSGITSVKYYRTTFFGIPTWVNLYGITILTTSFVAEFKAYFIPQTSGAYTFQVINSDDYVAFFFNDKSVYNCCPGQSNYAPSATTMAIFQSFSALGAGTSSVTFLLQKGQAYPIQITYLNRLGTAGYNVNFIDPAGVTHDDWNGYLANSDALAKSCPNTLTTVTYTVPYTGTKTMTVTALTTVIPGLSLAEVVILVETPGGTSSSWSSWSFVPPSVSLLPSSSYLPTSTRMTPTISPSSTLLITKLSSSKFNTVSSSRQISTLSPSNTTNTKPFSSMVTTLPSSSPMNPSSSTYMLNSNSFATIYPVASSSSDAVLPPYTTVMVSGTSSETAVVSFYTSTDSSGKPTTVATTYPVASSSSDAVLPPYTTVLVSGTSSETNIVSFYTSTDSSGKPTTVATTYPVASSSSDAVLPPYTTVMVSGTSSETAVVSFYTSTDSSGKPTTVATTYPVASSSSGMMTQSVGSAITGNYDGKTSSLGEYLTVRSGSSHVVISDLSNGGNAASEQTSIVSNVGAISRTQFSTSTPLSSGYWNNTHVKIVTKTIYNPLVISRSAFVYRAWTGFSNVTFSSTVRTLYGTLETSSSVSIEATKEQ
ncbi:hypothetical protein NCAS_0F02540 [Naumovozyma castellii]|uniref:PA14 domain-containing protein n=1 Tax=Naumovozyma castellii TaxID=27288 RepID=G0VGW7_NAUCA|nr:hypothetical protein NCAS_0F02540 [Naumovozyma castellii CBS 4309]CCC70738.1 hypothetical protein NCAS_0F02540 [Naumovozyma castellii CBS 4309]